jgi:hypothetical protein
MEEEKIRGENREEGNNSGLNRTFGMEGACQTGSGPEKGS